MPDQEGVTCDKDKCDRRYDGKKYQEVRNESAMYCAFLICNTW